MAKSPMPWTCIQSEFIELGSRTKLEIVQDKIRDRTGQENDFRVPLSVTENGFPVQ